MEKKDLISEVIRVLKWEAQAILECADLLHAPVQRRAIEQAVEFFQKSLACGGKIVVTGMGKSGKIGQKMVATFCSTGSLAAFLHPSEAVHGDLGILTSKDTVLVLSQTGNTEEILRLLPSLRALSVAVIGMGGNRDSKLAMGCDVWIDSSVEKEACPLNLAPTSSTTLSLALGDALAVVLMQLREFGADDFAKNHPGGSLGRKLNLKIRELMVPKNGLATVRKEASLLEVVEISTQMKLGGILVVDGDRLLGLITDGDIRRALRHREKCFDLTAAEVMTRSPVVADPEMLASTALGLMENRQSQISVLPIVEASGIWTGLLRLHDLVRAF